MTIRRVTARQAVVIMGCLVVIAGVAWLLRGHWTEPIDSYARCVADGNPVSETNPPVCEAKGRRFIGAVARPVPTPPPAVSQPIELLVHGDSRGSYPARQEVIGSQAAWEAYWRTVHASISPLPPIIPIDFTAAAVVALSYGQKPTGGYDVKVTGVTTSSAGSVIDVTQTIPGDGCVVTASITNPYMIIRTSKLAQPATFRTTTQKHSC